MEKGYQPTTRSFIDTDMYKLTMGQYVFHQHPDVKVTVKSKNRTKDVCLADIVDGRELRHELDRIQNVRPTTAELDYLANLRLDDARPIFKDDYLDFLANKLEMSTCGLNDNFEMEVKGLWKNEIYWETPALATENELLYRALKRNMTPDQLVYLTEQRDRLLEEKIKLFEQNPTAFFMEFGTRRRESFDNQEYVMGKLKARVPGNMVGTSNVYLAMKYGLKPMGTMAHETFMVRAAMMANTLESLRASHNIVLNEWTDEYGTALSIALTDTFGTDFFFRDMSQEQAEQWKGMRQDSADPFLFKKRQVDFYEQRGIDPTQKLFVPSDGLNVPKIVALNNYLPNRIKQVAGLGTDLTNDFGKISFQPLFKPISLVMKVVEANGRPTVKLSDNLAKGTGPMEERSMYCQVFGYDPTKYIAEECKY
jgi:nicotinate phosphoribosyltransferase